MIRGRILLFAIAHLTAGASVAPPVWAQAAGTLRASAVLSADTVRVGEPFLVGVVAVSSDSISMPLVLESGEGWEQLDLARVETTGSEVRAFYRLVAWRTDPIRLPDLTLSAVGSGGERKFAVHLPFPFVRSVIPASEQAPLLQPPRPPLETGFNWGLVLAALILAAMVLWWFRYRTSAATAVRSETSDLPDPRTVARDALLALRTEAETGSVAAAGFYDALERILRGYLSGTRAWPPGSPVRESTDLATAEMRGVHRQALLARFAAVGWPAGRLVSDADCSLAWLGEDLE